MSRFLKYYFYITCFTILFASCKDGQTSTTKSNAKASKTTSNSNVDKLSSVGFQIDQINDDGYEFWTRTVDNRRLESGTVKNGVKDGAWITYHDDRLNLSESIGSYKNGVLHGTFTKIGTNGVATDILFFVNGIQEGSARKYKNARLIEESYYKNGKLDGPRKTYYGNGEIKVESNFANGKREGVEKYYDEEGNVSIEYKYREGVRLKK